MLVYIISYLANNTSNLLNVISLKFCSQLSDNWLDFTPLSLLLMLYSEIRRVLVQLTPLIKPNLPKQTDTQFCKAFELLLSIEF